MTLEEAKMTLYANFIYACEKAGFDLSTICMVDDALRTVIAIADRKTESNSEKPNNSTISKMEQVEQRSCDTCKNRDVEGWKNPCLGCTGFAFYEPKDEPQKHCHRPNNVACHPEQGDMWCRGCDYWYANEPQTEREGE